MGFDALKRPKANKLKLETVDKRPKCRYCKTQPLDAVDLMSGSDMCMKCWGKFNDDWINSPG